MTQTVEMTAGTSGTETGFGSGFGSVDPDAVYGYDIVRLSHDSAADTIVLTLVGSVQFTDGTLALADTEDGDVTLDFADATIAVVGANTSFTWDYSGTPFLAAEVYEATLDPISYNCECDDETNHETLAQLRTRMMVRLGYAAQAANPPPGMATLLDDFLRSAQRKLYRKYPQTRTVRFFTWNMTPGVRFYDIGDNIDACDKVLNALKRVWVGVEDLNGTWYELADGIRPELYTSVMYPSLPARYEIRQCIEVFPAPDAAYRLRIKGHFDLGAFTDDADQTTVDSELVFLWALADAKAHYEQPDAAAVRQEAKDYLGTLVADDHGTKRYVPKGADPAPVPRPVMRDGFDG